MSEQKKVFIQLIKIQNFYNKHQKICCFIVAMGGKRLNFLLLNFFRKENGKQNFRKNVKPFFLSYYFANFIFNSLFNSLSYDLQKESF